MSNYTTGDYLYLAIESAIVLAGILLAWRQRSTDRQAGLTPETAPLAFWELTPEAYAFAVLRVLLTAFAVWLGTASVLKFLAPTLAQNQGIGLIIVGGSFHVGLLAGVAVAKAFMRTPPPWDLISTQPATRLPMLPKRRIFWEGFSTFLIVCAAVIPVTLVWRLVLGWFGYDGGEQEMVDVLRQADSRAEIVAMGVLAVLIAPVAEELVFRAGLFRFLRGRTPRVVAFLAPALFFALIHFNVQALPGLFVLAILFSRAYERTGRISVPMIAHALFNLHTLVQIMLESRSASL